MSPFKDFPMLIIPKKKLILTKALTYERLLYMVLSNIRSLY